MLFDGNKVVFAFSKQGTEAEDDVLATVDVRRCIEKCCQFYRRYLIKIYYRKLVKENQLPFLG